MAQIELKSPRVIAISDRGRHFQLTLARVTKRQWLKYFEGIISLSENQGGKRVDRFDSSAARLELVESVLADAKGYATADGSPATSLPNWQQMIPLAHRMAAGNALVSVERGTLPEDEPFLLGAETVYLDAVWSADEHGVMQKYSGLKHAFKTPTSDHQRRFSRDSSRSMIVSGSRKGTTRWMGAQATLAEIYDELIVSVEGYTVDGKPLGSDQAAIAAEMDTFHKVAAADVLFSPAQPNLDDEEE